MNILITGARGFIGKNLVTTLSAIQEGKDKRCSFTFPLRLYEYDADTDPAMLDAYCRDCDFVFHLAGVNRPEREDEFMEGNFGFSSLLLDTLKKHNNTCPVLLSSSIQAERDNPYGRSKAAGEALLRAYGEETGAPVYLYRFPNVFGKWCRPNYNSVVATFCHNIARGLPIQVNDPEAELTLVYIDDVVSELLAALRGQPHKGEDGFCRVPVTHQIKLGELAALLHSFRDNRSTLALPELDNPLTAKLYATYLSYLPEDGFSYPLTAHADARGSFAEFLRTPDRGQVSVNVSKPHVIRGNHWHHTKNEKFLVVSGRGVIRFRSVLGGPVTEYFVSGEQPVVVDIPTGYVHNIENLGDTDMVTVMWASECYDPARTDTYAMEV